MTHEERSAARAAKSQANKEAWARNMEERRAKRRTDKATGDVRKPAKNERSPVSKAAKAAKRIANRDAWMSSPRNTNTMWRLRREAESALMPEIIIDQMASSGSSSLAMLRAVMADTASPIYRRLDAADVIIDYELAPGAAANVPPDQLASSAYQFYRQVAAAEDTPEGLKFRAMKAIARVENSRKAAAQTPEAHFANREFHRRLINTARSMALREAGVWEQVVETGAHWSLSPRDSFEPPVLPAADVNALIEKDGSAEYLDACNRRPREQREQFAAERARILLAVRATNRVDDWDNLLGGDHA